MPQFTDRVDPEEVNRYHLASDKDAGPGALHHTLGLGSSQASAGNHVHNGRDSLRIKGADLKSGNVSFASVLSTNGTQPTFSATFGPIASYVKLGDLVYFQIEIAMTNITNFGSGQYALSLPFESNQSIRIQGGWMHDASTGRRYGLSGYVAKNTNSLTLSILDVSTTRAFDANFTSADPVTLVVSDSFHIAGSYEIKS